MKQKLVKVKTYHLSGDGMQIEFSMKDPVELELIYKDKDGERRFSGRAIYRDEVQLGFMPTVALEETPDLHRITLSIAVPSANRPENAKSIPVKTFAVRTTARTSIAGPDIVEGQIQTHEVYHLEGNAW